MSEILERMDCNPIEGLAIIAIGDVVKAGYMTPKELKEPPTFDRNGRVIRPSGVERALGYLHPTLRCNALKELAQYMYPKRHAIAHTDPNGNAIQASVVVMLPPNGR